MKHIDDIWQRALKTFIQAFFGILIPELVVFLQDIQISGLSWESLWYAAVPIICSALAAAISAGWNTVNNWLAERNELPDQDNWDER